VATSGVRGTARGARLHSDPRAGRGLFRRAGPGQRESRTGRDHSESATWARRGARAPQASSAWWLCSTSRRTPPVGLPWVRSVSLARSADAELQPWRRDGGVSRNGALLGGASRRFTERGVHHGLHIGSSAAPAWARSACRWTGIEQPERARLVFERRCRLDGSNSGRASLGVSANGGGSGPTLTTGKPDYLPGDAGVHGRQLGAERHGDHAVRIRSGHTRIGQSARSQTPAGISESHLRRAAAEPGVTFTATAVANPSGARRAGRSRMERRQRLRYQGSQRLHGLRVCGTDTTIEPRRHEDCGQTTIASQGQRATLTLR
jgi:hypothetical protein